MAGQGTLADEVVLSGHGPFDAAYLQIGGGGLAAGVSTWLKTYWPDIEIVGVEGVGQASMKAALAAGQPVALDQVDLFCDGTAVRKAGELPFQICRDTLGPGRDRDQRGSQPRDPRRCGKACAASRNRPARWDWPPC